MCTISRSTPVSLRLPLPLCFTVFHCSRFWIAAYIFLVGVLYSELFVGVIITLYSDVAAISSAHVFSVLEPVFRDFSSEERDLLIEDMLELSHRTASYNVLFSELLSTEKAVHDHALIASVSFADELMNQRSLEQPAGVHKEHSSGLELLNSEFTSVAAKLFQAIADKLVADTASRGRCEKGWLQYNASNTDLGAQFDIEMINSQIRVLTQRLRGLSDHSDNDEANLLYEFEKILHQWVTQLIHSLCEQSCHAFCFPDGTNQEPNFEHAAAVHSSALRMLDRLPEMNDVSKSAAVLCRKLTSDLGELFLERSSTSLEKCVNAVRAGLELHVDQPLLVAAECWCNQLAAMGQAVRHNDSAPPQKALVSEIAGWFQGSPTSKQVVQTSGVIMEVIASHGLANRTASAS